MEATKRSNNEVTKEASKAKKQKTQGDAEAQGDAPSVVAANASASTGHEVRYSNALRLAFE